MFYINYEEFKDNLVQYTVHHVSRFYINYEEFKDTKSFLGIKAGFRFILTMRNLKKNEIDLIHAAIIVLY